MSEEKQQVCVRKLKKKKASRSLKLKFFFLVSKLILTIRRSIDVGLKQLARLEISTRA